jgi:hypothetical protein
MSRTSRRPRLARLRGLLLLIAVGYSWTSASRAASESVDYLQPRQLLGSVFPIGGGQPLFRSERRSFETNDAVNVISDFTSANGEVAVRSRTVFREGQLVSLEEEQLQLGEKGSVVIAPDSKHPGIRKLIFSYTAGHGSAAHTATASETLQNDTLANGMIGPFIAFHFDLLQQGRSVKFRLLVLSRKETIGFKLIKEAESSHNGVPIVRLRMEPTSIIIARLVDPLFFEVEKEPPHRVLQYKGRTSLFLRSGNKWKELDATCVYDWASKTDIQH